MTTEEKQKLNLLNLINDLETTRSVINGSACLKKSFFGRTLKIKTLFSSFKFPLNGCLGIAVRAAIGQELERLRADLKKLER